MLQHNRSQRKIELHENWVFPSRRRPTFRIQLDINDFLDAKDSGAIRATELLLCSMFKRSGYRGRLSISCAFSAVSLNGKEDEWLAWSSTSVVPIPKLRLRIEDKLLFN